MKKPYIGVTGIFDLEDLVVTIREAFYNRQTPFPTNYQLMVGVLVSYNTMSGRRSEKFPNRYPAIESIPRLLDLNPGGFLTYLIHYNSKQPNLSDQLAMLVDICGQNLEGFQLNICWPDPKELQKFRTEGRGHTVVLQVGEKAFEAIDNNPVKLADKIRTEYYELVDYVLLDPSGGTGKEMSIAGTDGYLSELYGHGLNKKLRFGIAGGLHSGNLESIRPLVEKYDSLSIDAESKLRHPHDDTLNYQELIQFIRTTKELMASKKLS